MNFFHYFNDTLPGADKAVILTAVPITGIITLSDINSVLATLTLAAAFLAAVYRMLKARVEWRKSSKDNEDSNSD